MTRPIDAPRPDGMIQSAKAVLRAATLLVLPTLAVCLVLLEIGLRLLGRLPSNTTDGMFEAHGGSYRLRKDMTKVSRTPSFTCTIHTNSWGFRDRAPGPRALGPAPYDVFLGDSLTFGNGVEYDDSFVGVFAARARADGSEVANLAVGGHHLGDQEELLRDLLASAPREPARVVVMFTAPLVSMFDRRYSDILVKQGYLFQRDAWVLPYATVMLGNASSAYCFFRDGVRKVQARLFPSGDRVALEMLSAFSRDAPVHRPEVARRLEAALAGLDATIRRAGAVPVYAYLPSAADLRTPEFLRMAGRRAEEYDFGVYARVLEDHCARAGIQLVDLRPALERERAKGLPLSFSQDMHYNVAANRAIGEALADALLPRAR